MPVSKFVDKVKRVETSIISNSSGNDLKGLGEHVHD